MANEKMKLPAESTTIVIFGASGDLTRRKLILALYNLYRKKRLPAGLRLVGFARRPYSDQDFRDHPREGVVQFGAGTFEAKTWSSFSQNL